MFGFDFGLTISGSTTFGLTTFGLTISPVCAKVNLGITNETTNKPTNRLETNRAEKLARELYFEDFAMRSILLVDRQKLCKELVDRFGSAFLNLSLENFANVF